MTSKRNDIIFETREALLTHAAQYFIDNFFRDEIAAHEIPVPFADIERVRVSVGFPRGQRPSGRTRGGGTFRILGTCHPRSHSTDGYTEIFISPECDDLPLILTTLAHELCHAVLDCQDGHRGRFKLVAHAIGLTGRMRDTKPTADLSDAIEYMIDTELGKYPASAMTGEPARPKQTTRMLKIVCDGCGFTGRTSRKWAEILPQNAICPVCNTHHLNCTV